MNEFVDKIGIIMGIVIVVILKLFDKGYIDRVRLIIDRRKVFVLFIKKGVDVLIYYNNYYKMIMVFIIESIFDKDLE